LILRKRINKFDRTGCAPIRHKKRQPRRSQTPKHSSPEISPQYVNSPDLIWPRISNKINTLCQRYGQEISFYRRVLIGNSEGLNSFILSRWIFLRSLGIIYLLAFGSLWIQVDGLIGTQGILPANQYISAIWEKLGIIGYWTFPTLCWVNCSDVFIHALCASAILFSVSLILGILPIPALACLWAIYLSFSTITRTFLGYQWDSLLLETGFLAIFIAPGGCWPRISKERLPSRICLFLAYCLLFRLMFSSGVVKLGSGDLSWRTLTALNFHYQTQPLPNLFSWYAHQLPAWFQKLSVAATLAIEVALPFLFFAPRRLRLIAWAGTSLLQILIIATGNYCFFNLLALALCILLVDDSYLLRLLPKKVIPTSVNFAPTTMTSHTFSIFLVIMILPLSYIHMKPRVFRLELSELEKRLYSWSSPFRTVNSYGLFAAMTKSRPEILIQGSHDQKNWKTYEFKWKPGPLNRRPSQIAPHQPRIDWQMWFEALNYLRGGKPTLWFRSFLIRVLEGEEKVLKLLGNNPFSEAPPRYIRAVVYDYQFTEIRERKKSNNWWKRKYLGVYVPTSSLPKK